MKKLMQIQAARLVKQKNGEWYFLWYNQNPTQRFRHKFGLNRIKDLEIRQMWADAILKHLTQAALTGRKVRPSDIDALYQPSEKNKPTIYNSSFLVHAKQYIALRENVLTYGTLKTLTTCLNNLCSFAKDKLKKEAPDFTDFDIDFPLRYQSWAYAIKRKHSRNYVAKTMDILRQFLRDAEEHDIETGKSWKTKKYVIGRVQVDEISLTLSEVERIAKLGLKGKMNEVRDIFIVACLTGLRFSDVTRVNASHIKSLKKGDSFIKVLKINTIKTGERVVVPLHPFVRDIMDKYTDKLPKSPCNQVFNRYLKDIGKMAGFTEGVSLRVNIAGRQEIDTQPKHNFITTHTARRTFATIAFMEFKMPAGLIMKITGHRTEKEFFKYIKISQEQAAIEMWDYMTKE